MINTSNWRETNSAIAYEVLDVGSIYRVHLVAHDGPDLQEIWEYI